MRTRWMAPKHVGMALVTALALSATLLSDVSPVAAQSAPAVAVLPFQSGGAYVRGGADTRSMERDLAQSLSRELGNRQAHPVSASEVNRALQGVSLGSEGRIDAASAAKVGAAVGASHVVAGSFMDHYGKVRLDARVIDVRTGKVVKTASAGPGERANLATLVSQLADQVAAGLR